LLVDAFLGDIDIDIAACRSLLLANRRGGVAPAMGIGDDPNPENDDGHDVAARHRRGPVGRCRASAMRTAAGRIVSVPDSSSLLTAIGMAQIEI
jgi:hypothetical protein